MNEVVSKFLLTGDKFVSELHLKQPRFTDSACGPLTKHSESIKKFKGTRDLNYKYNNELDIACFAHHAIHANSKYLVKSTVSDKVLKDSTYEIAINPNYDGY